MSCRLRREKTSSRISGRLISTPIQLQIKKLFLHSLVEEEGGKREIDSAYWQGWWKKRYRDNPEGELTLLPGMWSRKSFADIWFFTAQSKLKLLTALIIGAVLWNLLNFCDKNFHLFMPNFHPNKKLLFAAQETVPLYPSKPSLAY